MSNKYISKNKINIFAFVVLLIPIILIAGCKKEAKTVETPDNISHEIIVDRSAYDASNEVINDISEYDASNEVINDISEYGVSDEVGNDESEYDIRNEINIDKTWQYADFSAINSGCATLSRALSSRKDIIIGINAGHGTKGGDKVKTYCHPDKTPKVTGGTTSEGAIKSIAVSGGMTFLDGTKESDITLKVAQILKEKLLSEGYDVLMLRDSDDVQLDNIARTVICNNVAACHIAIHFDGDNLDYDKGCFYISTPDGIKNMAPVSSVWEKHEMLGKSLITGLKENGCKIYKDGSMSIDLTQTSFSTVPSVDIELGNAASKHDDESLSILADGLLYGINQFFDK